MSLIDPLSFDILLVEDNEEDVYLTRRAFKDSKLAVNLYVAEDGIEAMDFLNKRGKYKDAPDPDLILLDLNLPKKDGREVLSEIKESNDLKSIPVVVLTTSEATEDIIRSYKLHANSFVRKPVTFDRFTEVIRSIEMFWLTVVKLPSGKKPHDNAIE